MSWLHALEGRERHGVDVPVLKTAYEETMLKTAQNVGLSYQGSIVPYSEIEAFIRISGIPMSMSDIYLVRDLSATYINKLQHYSDSKNKDALPPFLTEATHQRLQDEFNANVKETRAAKNKELAEKNAAKQKRKELRKTLAENNNGASD